MSDKIPTAEEILNHNLEFQDVDCDFPIWKYNDVAKAMKEFAKLHVTSALKACADKHTLKPDGDFKGTKLRKSILQAYDLNLIQ